MIDWGYVAILSAAIFTGVAVKRLSPAPVLPRAALTGGQAAPRMSDSYDASELHHAQPALSRVQRLALFLGVVIGSTFFAKLPYALLDWDRLVDGSAWLQDGRTITWGLVGGYLGVEVAKFLSGVRHKTGDGFAAPVAASIAIGRLGCLYAGCCFGAPSSVPWAMTFGDGTPRHPNQLYEAAFHGAAALLLLYAARKRMFPFQLMKLYIISYMLWRVFTETLRPEPAIWLGLTFYQLSALSFAVVFYLLFRRDSRLAAA